MFSIMLILKDNRLSRKENSVLALLEKRSEKLIIGNYSDYVKNPSEFYFPS
jgi:hypothetical protein